MKTMKDYHDLCLKCEFYLLTDVFEKVRNNSLKNYRLYPSHYLSTPVNAKYDKSRTRYERWSFLYFY